MHAFLVGEKKNQRTQKITHTDASKKEETPHKDQPKHNIMVRQEPWREARLQLDLGQLQL